LPRPIWKGAISFGLVTTPVVLYPATESRHPSFHQLRREDHSPIRHRRVAEADGSEAAVEDGFKGFEFEKDGYAVFTDEEVKAALRARRSGTVDVAQFVDAGQIDPVYYRQSYYLAPEQAGAKAYRILLRALEEGGVVGLARVALREREYAATLHPAEGVLILETMY
jgi:DNA end-binding protein Ku